APIRTSTARGPRPRRTATAASPARAAAAPGAMTPGPPGPPSGSASSRSGAMTTSVFASWPCGGSDLLDTQNAVGAPCRETPTAFALSTQSEVLDGDDGLPLL